MAPIVRLIRRSAASLTLFALLAIATVMTAAPASAQRVPPDNVIEIMIKRHLASFNDANITGNYTVWHATLSLPFRQQFTPERLKAAFKDFHDKAIDIAPILVERPILSEPASIDNEGALILKGTFETRPSRVIFNLRMLPSDGIWKLIAIHVNVTPAEDQSGALGGKN